KGGVLGAEKMATTFNMLRGSDLIWGFVVNNYLLGKDPFPFDLLYWNSDSTRMPAKVHRYYLERFYRDNALASNELQLGEVLLDLSRINVPTYSIAAKEDHIAPAASVYRGVRLMGGDRRMVLGGSGHIAGIVNPPQLNKYQYWIRDDNAFPETLEQWRDGAIEHPGSWWLDWDAWLKKNSGGRKPVPARAPGERLKPLADAPGEFVRARYDEDPSAANGAAK
ncbi:MAG: class I poly(R)-hydroxyalkanoic acid synthase, partial [Pseudomonadota bacterium]